MIDESFWKGKKVFITGHTGFKGSWLSVWLHLLGASTFGYSLDPPTSPSLFEQAAVSKLLKDLRGDVSDFESLKRQLHETQPEIVFHMAAQPLVRESYIDPVGTYQTNVMGTVNLLEAVRSTPSIRAVVVITTDKCYENKEWVWGYRENEPLGGYDPYSSSKAAAELVVSAYRNSFFNPGEYGVSHKVALATARAGNVIGGGDYAKDRLIPDIIRSFRQGDKVNIRSPKAIRPWQHVLEPLRGYLTLGKALFEQGTRFAESWNFGPSDEDAKPVEWIVSYLSTRIPNNPGFKLDSGIHPHEAHFLKLDCSKAKLELGWRPLWALAEALDKTVEWSIHKGSSYLDLMARQIAEYEKTAMKE